MLQSIEKPIKNFDIIHCLCIGLELVGSGWLFCTSVLVGSEFNWRNVVFWAQGRIGTPAGAYGEIGVDEIIVPWVSVVAGKHIWVGSAWFSYPRYNTKVPRRQGVRTRKKKRKGKGEHGFRQWS